MIGETFGLLVRGEALLSIRGILADSGHSAYDSDDEWLIQFDLPKGTSRILVWNKKRLN